MGAASNPRRARVGTAKARPKQKGFIVTLAILVAATLNGYAADQSFDALTPALTGSIRTPFLSETNSSLPAGNRGQVDSKNLLETTTPAFPSVQLTGTPALRFKVKPEDSVVRLPGFNVNAQKYSDLEKRLDQIDRSIDREQLLSIPDKLDLMLNSDKILPRWIVFGEETAEKRARDAYKRVQILEMQRTVGLGLLYTTPETRKRLKADQKFLTELSAPAFDEVFTSHPWTRP
jgi:hypothetical protein